MAESNYINWFQRVSNLFRSDQEKQARWLYEDRIYGYLLWEAYYNNTIYRPIVDGGQRETLNAMLGNEAAADLAGIYNPVGRVVDLYQHVYGGEFGVDILAETTNNRIQDPLMKLWRWSNINITKQPMLRMCSSYGNVGLRIVVANGQDQDASRRRVYIKPEHPGHIADIELDERGNVIQVLLEYMSSVGIGTNRKTFMIRELMTRQATMIWRVERDFAGIEHLIPYDPFLQQDNGPNSVIENPMGIVPYVLMPHIPTDKTWGLNAFYRATESIDRLNALIVHINVQIHRHVKAKWAIAASGEPPVEIDLGDMTVAWFNTRQASAPTIEPLVAPLSLQDAINQTAKLIEGIEDELPEVKATAGRFLSGQSGETVAQLREPAEDRIALARINYEDALIRAQKIALSYGVYYDVWDIGAGSGTVESAQKSYDDGLEDHRFNSREVLPLTQNDRNIVAQGVGSDTSRKDRLRIRGYSAARIVQIETERTTEQAQALQQAKDLAQATAPPQAPQRPNVPGSGNPNGPNQQPGMTGN